MEMETCIVLNTRTFLQIQAWWVALKFKYKLKKYHKTKWLMHTVEFEEKLSN